jgi:hypothetical protein
VKFGRKRPFATWEKAREERMRMAPGTIRCAHCSWRFEGALLEDGVRAAREHRTAKHSRR